VEDKLREERRRTAPVTQADRTATGKTTDHVE
jgi:hypothetical protein